MFEGLADPAGYTFLPDDPPINVEALRSRYNRQVAGPPDGNEIWLDWVVRDCEIDTLVGYTPATIRGQLAEIGYHIFPIYWRKGFATMALRLTLNKLFSMSFIKEVQALVDTRSIASVALLKKLRFDQRRTIVGVDHFKGASSNEYEFVLNRAGRSILSPPDK